MVSGDRHIFGCLYCGEPGPYTDEHVICAGLGGDDRGWMLQGLVCKTCNTEVFSKLELKFLRSSPVALARLFLQPRTRNRGKATGKPTLQTSVSYIYDADTDTLLEAMLEAGGVAQVLPQIGTLPQLELFRTGPDNSGLSRLLTEVSAAVAASVTLLEKRREGAEVKFEVTTLNWDGEQYVLCPTQTVSIRPKEGIWLESLERPATQPKGALLPRAFLRPDGQLICRVDGPEQAAQFLTTLRRTPGALQVEAAAEENRRVSNSGVHQRMTFDFDAYDRVLTKIGLNLTAHLLGDKFVRRAAFDLSIEYARTGLGNIRKYPPDRAIAASNIFGRALPDCHLFGLFQVAGQSTGSTLVFFARLYGGPLEGIILAEFDAPPPALVDPIIVHTNYVHHNNNRMLLEEHVVVLARVYPDDPFGLNAS